MISSIFLATRWNWRSYLEWHVVAVRGDILSRKIWVGLVTQPKTKLLSGIWSDGLSKCTYNSPPCWLKWYSSPPKFHWWNPSHKRATSWHRYAKISTFAEKTHHFSSDLIVFTVKNRHQIWPSSNIFSRYRVVNSHEILAELVGFSW